MYRVMCREDTKPDGTKGDFVLSGRSFPFLDQAMNYAKTISDSREPTVLAVVRAECPTCGHAVIDMLCSYCMHLKE